MKWKSITKGEEDMKENNFAHVPVEQYGFIQVDAEATDGEIVMLVDRYNKVKEEFKKSREPKDLGKPTYLGQTMIENGHTYKAVQTKGRNFLYWQIDKI